jgi:hypothetical protein
MEPSGGQFEVVSKDEKYADSDERSEPGVEGYRAQDADRCGSADADRGETGQDGGRNSSTERATIDLVEGVGADSDGQEERGERCDET